MFEIEAKVPLTKSDVIRIKKEIPKIAKFKAKSIKRDSYYGSLKSFFMRLREKGDQTILNIKSKKIEQGIEINHEIEWGIKSKSKFHNLLQKIDIPFVIKKEKHSEVYLHGPLQIELNYIPSLGYYLEIEYQVKTKKEIPIAKKKLHAIFKKFGFNPRQFEKRYYLDLIRT